MAQGRRHKRGWIHVIHMLPVPVVHMADCANRTSGVAFELPAICHCYRVRTFAWMGGQMTTPTRAGTVLVAAPVWVARAVACVPVWPV